MENEIKTPFSNEQVKNLNEYQLSGAMHPFTCDNSDCRGIEGSWGILVATNDGWICTTCDYTQNWAHAFMADGILVKRHKEWLNQFEK